MYGKLPQMIVCRLVERGYAHEAQREEYEYGMKLFLSAMAIMLSMALIAAAMGMFPEGVAVCVLYKWLRTYVGGYHANTTRVCYIQSCLIYAAILVLVKYFVFSDASLAITCALSAAVLLALSPVEALNKPLDDAERRVFGTRARIGVCITAFIAAILLPLHQKTWAAVVTVTLAAVAIAAIAGKIKWHITRRNA